MSDVLPANSVLTAAMLRRSWLEPADDVDATVARLLVDAGPGARLAIVPEGPQTVPYVGEAVESASHFGESVTRAD